jgi:lipoprotein NlpI
MDKAVVQMRKLLPLHAKDVQVTAQLAHRFAKAKAYADCKAAFTSAIELDKQQPAFYLHRGLCRHSLAEAEDTVRNDYNKALEIDAKFQPAWYYLGMSWLDSKKQQKALDAFDQCLRLGRETPVGKKAAEQIAAMKKAAKTR